mgnify:CR=1 FL=1
MKVLDRFSGVTTTLPQAVEPARYRLLKGTLLNGDIPLDDSWILFSDGRERCALGNETRSFTQVTPPTNQDSARSLISRSIAFLARLAKSQPSTTISPLIPASMADLAELNDLDKTLMHVIEKGHLDEIALRPRFAMKYETELTEISRVQRMAPGAVSRLAAHSEDWHRRTISGVLPSKLLALLSDDDWAIYENRVFARLLDRLDSYVRLRLAETEQMHEKYLEALKLAGAEEIYHQLRRRLCTLWGDAMKDSATEKAFETSAHAIKVLSQAKRKIGLIRQGDLYKKVPRSAHVPTQLRHTNILVHDQHYRHLRTLWHLHQTRTADMEQSPQEIHAANRRALEDFSVYLRMMLERVLSDMPLIHFDTAKGTFEFAGQKGEVSSPEDTIQLELADRKLVLVPTLTTSCRDNRLAPDGSGRLIVSCLPDTEELNEDTLTQNGTHLVINPFDFYGEEKLRLVMERFLWHPAFSTYGKQTGPLPSEVLAWLDKENTGVVTGNSWKLLNLLRHDQEQPLLSWLEHASLNDESRSSIKLAVDRLKALSSCRHCGNPAHFAPRDGEFLAICKVCNTEWGIYRKASKRTAQMRPADETEAHLKRFGSWFVEFEM